MPGLVIDASIAAAWCFPDEATQQTRGVLRAVGDSFDPIAPSLWFYEIHNTLLVGLKRGRIGPEDAKSLLTFLAGLDVQLVEPSEPAQIFALPEKHGLTFYDAAYLAMALRQNLPLATLDKDLLRAAKDAGVTLFQPPTDPLPVG